MSAAGKMLKTRYYAINCMTIRGYARPIIGKSARLRRVFDIFPGAKALTRCYPPIK
jgi:hypothetical protein